MNTEYIKVYCTIFQKKNYIFFINNCLCYILLSFPQFNEKKLKNSRSEKFYVLNCTYDEFMFNLIIHELQRIMLFFSEIEILQKKKNN